MSDEKSIRIIEFSGKQSDWDGWSEKFLAKAEHKGYRKLLLCKKSKSGFDIVPTESEYDAAEAKTSKDADDKKIIALAKLNRLAFMDLILSIDHKSSRGKVAFRLVKNCKSSAYPEGNCKLAWDRLVAKYAPKSTPSLLKMRKKFENSKLSSAVIDPEEWISELEGLRTEVEGIDSSSAMSDKDFMVKVLNNLPSEYDVILDGLENRLTLDQSDPNTLTIENIREKLNNRYERILGKIEAEEEKEEEKALVGYYKRQYKGRCSNCGEYGHKGADCPERDRDDNTTRNNTSRFTGTCYYCGKIGHQKSACKLFKKHRAEIEAGKQHDETANLGIEEIDDEDESDVDSLSELGF